jgi:peptide/nickel transport system permease protein
MAAHTQPLWPSRRQRGRRSYWLTANSEVTIGTLVVAGIALLAVLAPLLSSFHPDTIDLTSRLSPPGARHWAGTDELGRDIWSRTLFGTRLSLLMGAGISSIGCAVGSLLGAAAPVLGRWWDEILMRAIDVLMALPTMVVAMALTVALGPNLLNAMFALGVLSIPHFARIVRAQTLAVVQQEHYSASILMGGGKWHLLINNVLPNIIGSVSVLFSMHLGTSVLAASAVSFIGLGAQPPTAELGAMINAGRAYLLDQWWYVVAPGVVLTSLVCGCNLLGDGLREFFDPRAQTFGVA